MKNRKIRIGQNPNEPSPRGTGATYSSYIPTVIIILLLLGVAGVAIAGLVIAVQTMNSTCGSDGGQRAWYRDADSDGDGWRFDEVIQCSQPDGYSSNNLDCDDNDPEIFFGAKEPNWLSLDRPFAQGADVFCGLKTVKYGDRIADLCVAEYVNGTITWVVGFYRKIENSWVKDLQDYLVQGTVSGADAQEVILFQPALANLAIYEDLVVFVAVYSSGTQERDLIIFQDNGESYEIVDSFNWGGLSGNGFPVLAVYEDTILHGRDTAFTFSTDIEVYLQTSPGVWTLNQTIDVSVNTSYADFVNAALWGDRFVASAIISGTVVNTTALIYKRDAPGFPFLLESQYPAETDFVRSPGIDIDGSNAYVSTIPFTIGNTDGTNEYGYYMLGINGFGNATVDVLSFNTTMINGLLQPTVVQTLDGTGGFGYSLSQDDDHMFISKPYANAVDNYTRVDSVWTFQNEIKIVGTTALGYSVTYQGEEGAIGDAYGQLAYVPGPGELLC